MKIITGSTGQTHVTSGNDGEFNQMILGTGLVVFPNGNKLEASIIDNNTIQIKDGDLCFQGRHALIEPDTTEDIIIETGAVDKKRIDLIVAHYELNNSTGYEKLELKVLKGEETEGEPVAPTVTTGDIRRGALVAEVAMWKVTVNNVILSTVEPLFTPSKTLLEAVDDIVEQAIEDIGEKEEEFYQLVDSFRDEFSLLMIGTVSAGETSVTISNARINNDMIFDIYFEDMITAPSETPTVTDGSITITVDAPENDLRVGVIAKQLYTGEEA